MATTDPAPLSVAPVAAAHESRCAPTMTTSSLSFGSVPGISATVEPVLVFAPEFRLNVEFENHRHVGLQQTIRPAVILDGHHSDGQGIHLVALVRARSETGAVIIKNRSARAAAVFAIAARQDHGLDPLVRKKLPKFLPEFHSFQISLQKGLEIGRPDGVLLDLLQFGVVVSSEQRLSTGFVSRISPNRMIFPLSWPLYASKSFSSLRSAQTAGALTAPLVAGDQGAA